MGYFLCYSLKNYKTESPPCTGPKCRNKTGLPVAVVVPWWIPRFGRSLPQQRWVETTSSCVSVGWWGALRLHLLTSSGSSSTTEYLQQQKQVLDPTNATCCKAFILKCHISDRNFILGSRVWCELGINLLIYCTVHLLSITFLQPTRSAVGPHKPSSKEAFISLGYSRS